MAELPAAGLPVEEVLLTMQQKQAGKSLSATDKDCWGVSSLHQNNLQPALEANSTPESSTPRANGTSLDMRYSHGEPTVAREAGWQSCNNGEKHQPLLSIIRCIFHLGLKILAI